MTDFYEYWNTNKEHAQTALDLAERRLRAVININQLALFDTQCEVIELPVREETHEQ